MTLAGSSATWRWKVGQAAQQQLALVAGVVEVAAGQGLAGPGVRQGLAAAEVLPALVQKAPANRSRRFISTLTVTLPTLLTMSVRLPERGQGVVQKSMVRPVSCSKVATSSGGPPSARPR